MASLSFDQYAYVARRAGLSISACSVDLWQYSSLALLPLWPVLWLGSLWWGVRQGQHNRLNLLLGRILFLELTREP